MKIICTLLLGLDIILHSIESSSQSQLPSEPSSRIRSRSPTIEKTFPGVLGFGFEDLEFIRLRPQNSPNRVFELRVYIFPPDKPIGLKTKSAHLNPMPTGEQIVLSTSNGDAYAMLDKSACKTTILRAICTTVSGQKKRAKININSGTVSALTAEEIEECPVTVRDAISNFYKISRLSPHSESSPDRNSNPDVHRSGPPSPSPARSPDRSPPPARSPLRDRSRSPTQEQTSYTVLGYPLEIIESIRLIPKKYPHLKFKLQRYTFPQDKAIGLITVDHVLYPMPTGVQIVLSASNGDVCAMLQKTRWRTTLIRPIFTSNSGVLERVKINMISGAVRVMTDLEILECPGTGKVTVRRSYKVVRV